MCGSSDVRREELRTDADALPPPPPPLLPSEPYTRKKKTNIVKFVFPFDIKVHFLELK